MSSVLAACGMKSDRSFALPVLTPPAPLLRERSVFARTIEPGHVDAGYGTALTVGLRVIVALSRLQPFAKLHV